MSGRLGWPAGRIVLLGIVAAVAAGSARADGKIPLKSAADLPRYSYTLGGTATEVLQSDELFGQLAIQVRADIEADLSKYEIDDPALLRRYYVPLTNLDLLEGRWDDVLRDVARLRESESGVAARLSSNLDTEALALARKEVGDDMGRFREVLRRILLEKIRRQPWGLIAADIKDKQQQVELGGEGALMAIVQREIEPAVTAAGGEIGADLAYALIGLRVSIRVRGTLRDALGDVYKTVIEEHRVPKKDIWAERAVTLPTEPERPPVIVAAWDFGVDAAVFQKQLFVNPRETVNGKDDDDNGFVDDVHGIAFDLDGNRVTELLPSLKGLSREAPELLRHIKGFQDARAGLENADTEAAQRLLIGLNPDQAKTLYEDFCLVANACQGTHAAGLMLDGNPFARLLVARLTFDHHTVPRCPTRESVAKEVAALRATIAYFKRNQVQVVSIGWGHNRGYFEAALEAAGAESGAAERAALGRELFKTWSEGLYEAMREAPEILFVAGIGGVETDAQATEMVPAGFSLPNLLAVGAVDQAGEPLSFTSFVKAARVYAGASEVESVIPGGQRVKFTGLAEVAPQAANLAAKLLVQKPGLSPAQIIARIVEGADVVESVRPMRLMNPKRTLAGLTVPQTQRAEP